MVRLNAEKFQSDTNKTNFKGERVLTLWESFKSYTQYLLTVGGK